ncbi:MAG: Mth938-like domain-containing protein [Pseudomonadota bacterium]
MRVSEISYEGPPPIDSYGAGGFRVREVFHEGGLLITPANLMQWDHGAPLTPADFVRIEAEASDIDVLLIGMGPEIAPLPSACRAMLEGAGVGAEIMSTPSACRTYNVLLAEDRRVAAALIAI